jgi:hypothetical protein
MRFIEFLQSGTGRVVRVAIGFALIYYGATHASLFGIVLTMVGMVPAVTGIAGICLLDELIKARFATGAGHARPREGRV